MTNRTSDAEYTDKIIMLKRERIYRPIIPLFDELRLRIDQLEHKLKDHETPRPRGRPSKVERDEI